MTDLEGEAESFHSAGVSPATSASMSITHSTAELQLVSLPPAPLPSSIQLKTDPAQLLQLATAYHEWLPQPPPDPVPVSSLSLFREGPFDAATCPAATSEHPLITNQTDGCPYRFTCHSSIWSTNTRSLTPHLVCKCAIHNSWSGWGRQNMHACLVGHIASN